MGNSDEYALPKMRVCQFGTPAEQSGARGLQIVRPSLGRVRPMWVLADHSPRRVETAPPLKIPTAAVGSVRNPGPLRHHRGSDSIREKNFLQRCLPCLRQPENSALAPDVLGKPGGFPAHDALPEVPPPVPVGTRPGKSSVTLQTPGMGFTSPSIFTPPRRKSARRPINQA
jgi:hypothetical protein